MNLLSAQVEQPSCTFPVKHTGFGRCLNLVPRKEILKKVVMTCISRETGFSYDDEKPRQGIQFGSMRVYYGKFFRELQLHIELHAFFLSTESQVNENE